MAALFQDAAEAAALDMLVPLLERVGESIDLDASPEAERLIRAALVRSFLAGARVAAVEVTAQLIEAGVNVELYADLIDPGELEDIEPD